MLALWARFFFQTLTSSAVAMGDKPRGAWYSSPGALFPGNHVVSWLGKNNFCRLVTKLAGVRAQCVGMLVVRVGGLGNASFGRYGGKWPRPLPLSHSHMPVETPHKPMLRQLLPYWLWWC